MRGLSSALVIWRERLKGVQLLIHPYFHGPDLDGSGNLRQGNAEDRSDRTAYQR